MEEATVVRWLKQPGDAVTKGEELVEVETDKATIVYEAERDGVLTEIVTGEGATAELGAVIARLRVDAEAAPPIRPSGLRRPRSAAAATASAPPPATVPAPAATPPPSVSAVEIDFREGIRAALDAELARDERVILFGEDVAIAGGVFATTTGLYDTYGPTRVFDTPISELAMTGAAYGAAVTGLRPVLEIMFGDFLALSMDSLINQATKYWFLTEERYSVPLVIRSVVGAGGRFGAIHSQMPISWLTGITGLKIVAPSTPADAKGLLQASIRDDNPVIFFEHKRLYTLKGPEDEGRPYELGRAAVVREGSDVTIVSAMKGVHDSLAAAELLVGKGVSAEVIDLRTIRPHRSRDDLPLGREDEPHRRRRGRPTDGWLGGRGAGAGHESTARGPRRRLAHHDGELTDPVQPTARGRVPARRRAHRRRDREPAIGPLPEQRSQAMETHDTEVLIAGGSLVGLSTALFLGLRGVPSLVVERHPGTAIHPRAALFNQRTIELYREAGLEPEIVEASEAEFVQNGAVMSVESLGGKEIDWYFRNINEGVERLSPSPRLFVTQIGLEPILRSASGSARRAPRVQHRARLLRGRRRRRDGDRQEPRGRRRADDARPLPRCRRRKPQPDPRAASASRSRVTARSRTASRSTSVPT